MFLLKDPRTGKIEEVYDYPTCLASPILIYRNCQLVTREPLRIPILIVPNEYLTKMENCRATTEHTYASLEYVDYFIKDQKDKAEDAEYANRMHQVQTLFSMGSRICSHKTMFFTGPKVVYKKSFTDKWVWKQEGILCLTNVGHYATIKSLSLKGVNDVFITGTFKCGEEVLENTQCKISISNNS